MENKREGKKRVEECPGGLQLIHKSAPCGLQLIHPLQKVLVKGLTNYNRCMKVDVRLSIYPAYNFYGIDIYDYHWRQVFKMEPFFFLRMEWDKMHTNKKHQCLNVALYRKGYHCSYNMSPVVAAYISVMYSRL